MHQGYVFSPIHKRPVELTQSATRSKSIRSAGGTLSEHLSTMGASFYSVKNPNVLPVTNGLNDSQLSQNNYRLFSRTKLCSFKKQFRNITNNVVKCFLSVK